MENTESTIKPILRFLVYLAVTILVIGAISGVLYFGLSLAIREKLQWALPLLSPVGADEKLAIQDIGSWYQGIAGAVLSLAASAVGISIALVAYVLAANSSEREKRAHERDERAYVRDNSEFVANLLSVALSPVYDVLQKHKALMNSVQDFIQPIAAAVRIAPKTETEDPVAVARLKSYMLSGLLDVHKGVSDLRMAIDRFVAGAHPLSHQLMAAWFTTLQTSKGAARYFGVFEKPVSLDIARCVLRQIERRLAEFADAVTLARASDITTRDALNRQFHDDKVKISIRNAIAERLDVEVKKLEMTSLLDIHVTQTSFDDINAHTALLRYPIVVTQANRLLNDITSPTMALEVAVAAHLVARYRLRCLEETAFAVVRDAIKSVTNMNASDLVEIASKLLFFFGQSGPRATGFFAHWPGYKSNLDSVFAKGILEIIEQMMPTDEVVNAQIEKSYKLKVGIDFNVMALGECNSSAESGDMTVSAGSKTRTEPCLSLSVDRL